MILISKKISNGVYFDFDKILASGYKIREDNDRIIQKFANGHRKSINSSYTDVEITLSLGTFDLATTNNYISKLTSGTYKYYSLKDNQYKEASFIIEKRPVITVKSSATSSMVIEDYEIKLLKAGD